MAKGRTVCANCLTNLDEDALTIAKRISVEIKNILLQDINKNDATAFWNEYGKVSMSRDAGSGRGGGKLQRDALCTRGRTDKAPFSNRNLRWHPLVVAKETPDYKEHEITVRDVDDLYIGEDSSGKSVLIFEIDGEEYLPGEVYTLIEKYGPNTVFCVPYKLWEPLANELKNWGDTDWTRNSCVIPAYEYSPINYALESYATLAMIIAIGIYYLPSEIIYDSVTEILKDGLNSLGYSKLSRYYPKKDEIYEIVKCPLCKANITEPPANIRYSPRPQIWQPPWRSSKRKEGESHSLQLLHVEPLIERDIRHHARNVRYGHRWCNVAMTDHSIEETLNFMEAIVRNHKRC